MEFLKEALGEELFAQVSEKLNGQDNIRLVNAADGSFVPAEKFNREHAASKELKTQIQNLNGELETLKANGLDADKIRLQVQQLQNDIAAKDAEMTKQRVTYAIRDALRGAKAKNADIVMRMIDVSKVAEKDGTLEGIAEQIDALKASDGYLFETDEPKKGGFPPNVEPAIGKKDANAEMNAVLRKMAGR